MMTHSLILRSLQRCAETRGSTGLSPLVAAAYDTALLPLATSFLAAQDDADRKAVAMRNARTASAADVERVDQPYCTARAAMRVALPNESVPPTLKSLRTDTDMKDAIETLLALVRLHAGTPVADAVAAGEFGTLAPIAVTSISATIEAAAQSQRANQALAAAAEAVKPVLTRFKQVVRRSFGPSSREYRRLIRRSVSAPDTAPETTPTTTSTTTPAVTPPAATPITATAHAAE